MTISLAFDINLLAASAAMLALELEAITDLQLIGKSHDETA
jgi:hypothetical protein